MIKTISYNMQQSEGLLTNLAAISCELRLMAQVEEVPKYCYVRLVLKNFVRWPP